VQGIQRPRVLAVKEDRELLPDRFALRIHRGFEQIVLRFLRQAAPASSDGVTECA
jgi:hypothetical protein